MPFEDLNQNFFSRERVRNRMLKRAAEFWGFAESEMDDFDPIVLLLIEACAVEVEKVAAEVGKSQNRMLERLAELLHPSSAEIKPSYGIIQARASEPASILPKDAQFLYKPPASERTRDNTNGDFYFSPANAINIFDGEIKFLASSKELFQISDGIQKTSVASSIKRNASLLHKAWIGIELHDEIENLDGISFYFHWINQPESKNWYSYIPYSKWFLDGTPVHLKQGISYANENAKNDWQGVLPYDEMATIEQEILDLLHPSYLTITTKDSFANLKAGKKRYPPEFESLFEKNDLKKLKDDLIWLEIQFPSVIPQEALDNLRCSINAVPVINRKLNKLTYRLNQTINIVPLETDGSFLSIKEIINYNGQPISLVPFANPGDLHADSFTIRYGINRFDERNSREILVNLTELIKDESAHFSALGEDFLSQNIRELNQMLARIEGKLKLQNKNQSPFPFLIIKPVREGETVAIEFWSCNGEAANKIPVGTRLSPHRHSSVQSNSIFFISSTYGGHDKYDDSQKIDQYKNSLLTHNRIVTLSDLQIFLNAELGKTAASIECKRSYVKSEKPSEGFIQCLQVIVTPEPESLSREEWDQKLEEIRLKIEKRSTNNIPFYLKLSTK
jgi:hypothetical protein